MDFAALGISLILPWLLGVVWLRYRWQTAPDALNCEIIVNSKMMYNDFFFTVV